MTESILKLGSVRPAALTPPPRLTPAVEEDVFKAEELETGINSEQILRFRSSERMMHWSLAVPFMVCYATGMVLMTCFTLRSPGISRGLLSWTHKLAGAFLILMPALAAAKNWRDYKIHLYNIRQAWNWAGADLKWLILMGAAAISKRISLPEQGKFNAAEKLNFMMVMCTYPLFILTGVLLWLPGTIVLFWMVHVGLALIATPLMLGHIYMALINPSTRIGLSGMVSGYVDRRWSRHHYGRWYREHFGGPAAQPRNPEAAKCDKDSLD